MLDAGDILLFALSCWKETPWQRFKNAVAELPEPERLHSRSAYSVRPMAIASILAELGHCDVIPDSQQLRVVIAPMVLARIPQGGLPKAVLCGSRSPSLLRDLIASAQHTGIRATCTPQSRAIAAAPSLVIAEGRSNQALNDFAHSAGLRYLETPPSWMLAEALGSIDEYLDSLTWSTLPSLNWPSQEFDPVAGRFRDGYQSVGLRLVRYKDPIRETWLYRLWRGSECSHVDQTWARYAVLKEFGKQVIDYKTTGQLRVPVGIPFPIVASRCLVLCSGRAPEARNGAIEYSSIPHDVAAAVVMKLGQALAPMTEMPGS